MHMLVQYVHKIAVQLKQNTSLSKEQSKNAGKHFVKTFHFYTKRIIS